jgi:hypothetical protein
MRLIQIAEDVMSKIEKLSLATQDTKMPLSAQEIIQICKSLNVDPIDVYNNDAQDELRGIVVDFPDVVPPGEYTFFKGGGEYGHMTTDRGLAAQYGDVTEVHVRYNKERTAQWQSSSESSGTTIWAPGLPVLLLLWGDIDGICQVVRLRQ